MFLKCFCVKLCGKLVSYMTVRDALTCILMNIKQLDRSGLHFASANGHEETVHELFDHGADDDTADKVPLEYLINSEIFQNLCEMA